MSVSVPRSIGQLPVYYSLGKQNKYVEGESTPLYSFGFGLSYTQFEYSDLEVKRQSDNTLISFNITNIGERDGEEVPQLYIRDVISSVFTPPIQLKDFERIHIRKGETKEVTFVLDDSQLTLFNKEMKEVVEPGEFSVMIGAASNDIRLRGSFIIE